MNFIVACIQMVDNNLHGRFRPWRKEDDDKEVKQETARQKKLRDQRLEKMRYIDEELRKENERIQMFLKAKQEHMDRKAGIKRKWSNYLKVYDSQTLGIESIVNKFQRSYSCVEVCVETIGMVYHVFKV